MQKKILGFVILGVGVLMFVYFLYSFIFDKNRMISPVPDDKGVKVIYK